MIAPPLPLPWISSTPASSSRRSWKPAPTPITFRETTTSTTLPSSPPVLPVSHKKPTKQTVLIIGDSIPKYLNGQRMSKRFNVINECMPSSKLEMWIKLVPMFVKEYKPTSVSIHCGTNNISRCYPDLCIYLHKCMISNILSVTISLQIAVSSLTAQRNVGHSFWIKEFNARLKDLCTDNSLTFINNDNIDRAYLGRDGLHLKPAGVFLLARNYIAFLKELWNASQEFHLLPSTGTGTISI